MELCFSSRLIDQDLTSWFNAQFSLVLIIYFSDGTVFFIVVDFFLIVIDFSMIFQYYQQMLLVSLSPFIYLKVVNSLFLLLGCIDSEKSDQIYERMEKKHAFMTKMLKKASIATAILASSVSVLFPVSYSIFAYPPPELWTMPLETQ